MFSGSTLMSGCSFSNVATSSSGVALGSSKWYHQRIVAFFCACGRASGVAASGSCSAEQCASFHWHFPPAIDGTITAAKQLFVPTASWLPFSHEPSSSMPKKHLVQGLGELHRGVADCHHERSASISDPGSDR
jgi:hypothetical protein